MANLHGRLLLTQQSSIATRGAAEQTLELRILPRLKGSAKTYYWEIYALPTMRVVRRKVYNGVITLKTAEQLGQKALDRLRKEGTPLPPPGMLRIRRT